MRAPIRTVFAAGMILSVGQSNAQISQTVDGVCNITVAQGNVTVTEPLCIFMQSRESNLKLSEPIKANLPDSANVSGW